MIPDEPCVIHQDDHLVVVHKPSGWLTHNSEWSGPRERSLASSARTLSGAAVFGVQRLDRGASGLVVFARASEGARRLQDTWHAPGTRKRYLALVRGALERRVDVDHPVADEDGDRRDARSTVLPLGCSDVERVSLVEVELHTGRHRQIRRHMHHLSHPIVGDSSHGDGPFNRRVRDAWGLSRLALHCWRLSLPHPADGRTLSLVDPLPEDLRAAVTSWFGASMLPRLDARP